MDRDGREPAIVNRLLDGRQFLGAQDGLGAEGDVRRVERVEAVELDEALVVAAPCLAPVAQAGQAALSEHLHGDGLVGIPS